MLMFVLYQCETCLQHNTCFLLSVRSLGTGVLVASQSANTRRGMFDQRTRVPQPLSQSSRRVVYVCKTVRDQGSLGAAARLRTCTAQGS
jgi:hypothetical protein